MTYLPIEDHGVIGNMRTAALVGIDGSIDWLCLPHFDSPSVFAAILDDEKGGEFSIAPANLKEATCRQLYWPGTNVLVTRFLSADGIGEVQDFMPVGPDHAGQVPQLVRRVRVSTGELSFVMKCDPAFDYARADHHTTIDQRGCVFESPQMNLILESDVPLERTSRGASCRFRLKQGECATFGLREGDSADSLTESSAERSLELFETTVRFWRDWLSQCEYTGRWRERVQRSALTLKLLTFEPSGAIIAAPTTSLPDRIGGGRNWDFRFTWIRDAAFSLYGLLRLGFTSEAGNFMQWLDARYRDSLTDAGHRENAGPLQVIYGINGQRDLKEIELDHLKGYRDSRPVRIGNRAHKTMQLDIYGELLDSVYLYNKHGAKIGYDAWTNLRSLVNWVAENWRQPDEGIWEIRGDPRQFVYSKIMCWVAIDRALRLAAKRSFPAEVERWRRTRDEIYEEVMARGWNEERQSMVQAYDSDCLDGSLLIMPLVFFMAPTDPKMLKTLAAIGKAPGDGGLTSDGLVRRFSTDQQCDDGVEGEEATFNMCSFWLVEALTRAGHTDARRLEEGRLLFERMLGYGNHLGLYAEQTGDQGQALGNFPQGFTHLGLISAAFNLDRQLGPGA